MLRQSVSHDLCQFLGDNELSNEINFRKPLTKINLPKIESIYVNYLDQMRFST